MECNATKVCSRKDNPRLLCRKSANCKRIWPGNWLLLPPSTAFDFAKAGNKTTTCIYKQIRKYKCFCIILIKIKII
jgi:hypothetical protein